ncbi:MAG: hypothetical protein MZV70_34420 [Desulfobacterales bacterium]|nr:hypothetical protein [Desulfobacterales bacterium]
MPIVAEILDGAAAGRSGRGSTRSELDRLSEELALKNGRPAGLQGIPGLSLLLCAPRSTARSCTGCPRRGR